MYNHIKPAFIDRFSQKDHNLLTLTTIKEDIINNLSALLNGRSKNYKKSNKHHHLVKSGLFHGQFDLVTKIKFEDYSKSYLTEDLKSIIEIFEPRLTLVDIFHINEYNHQESSTVFKLLVVSKLNVLSHNDHDFNIQTELDLHKKISTFSEIMTHE